MLPEVLDVQETGELFIPELRTPIPEMLSEHEVAVKLNCPVHVLRQMYVNGIGPCRVVRRGRFIGYLESDVEAWLRRTRWV